MGIELQKVFLNLQEDTFKMCCLNKICSSSASNLQKPDKNHSLYADNVHITLLAVMGFFVLGQLIKRWISMNSKADLP